MRRLIALALAFTALINPAVADEPFQKCDYYFYLVVLNGPFIAIESEPVQTDDKLKYLHATEEVCIGMTADGDGNAVTVPGTEHTHWKLSIVEDKHRILEKAPASTITVAPRMDRPPPPKD